MKKWNEIVIENWDPSKTPAYREKIISPRVLSAWNLLTDKEKTALALIMAIKSAFREQALDKARTRLPAKNLISYGEFKEQLIPSLIQKRILKANLNFELPKQDWYDASYAGLDELTQLKRFF